MSLSEKGKQHSYERYDGAQRLECKDNVELTWIKRFILTR